MPPGSVLPLALTLTVGEKEISEGLEESGPGKAPPPAPILKCSVLPKRSGPCVRTGKAAFRFGNEEGLPRAEQKWGWFGARVQTRGSPWRQGTTGLDGILRGSSCQHQHLDSVFLTERGRRLCTQVRRGGGDRAPPRLEEQLVKDRRGSRGQGCPLPLGEFQGCPHGLTASSSCSRQHGGLDGESVISTILPLPPAHCYSVQIGTHKTPCSPTGLMWVEIIRSPPGWGRNPSGEGRRQLPTGPYPQVASGLSTGPSLQ